jgi:hypothetical protein
MAQRPGSEAEFALARPSADRRRWVASRNDTRTDDRLIGPQVVCQREHDGCVLRIDARDKYE